MIRSATPVDEWLLGPDDHQVGLQAIRERGDRLRVLSGDVETLGHRLHAGVAGGDEDRVH